MSQEALTVTPAGHLRLGDAPATIVSAFARGTADGLLHLGTSEVTAVLAPALAFWRDLAARYVAAVCARGEDARGSVAVPEDGVLAALAASAPPMTGGEYVDAALLAKLWGELDAAFIAAVGDGDIRAFLRARNSAWNLVGRVHFNLAENRGDEEAPFAFLATYTTRLTARATAQHVPLGQALHEYAGARAKSQLRALLEPVRRAAESCGWLAEMVESNELFHPLRWTPADAMRLLGDVPKLEAAGVVVRMPASWGGRRPPRPEAVATVGAKPPGGFGGDALLDFRSDLVLDGEPLTKREIADLLAGTDGLRLLRGRWVEIDRERLRETIARLREVERAAAGGLGFAEAMRLIARAPIGEAAAGPRVVAAPWLAETLAGLRSPARLAQIDPGAELRAELRPYQAVGVRWLHLLAELGLGACLADDMGLGKTMQIIALLLLSKRSRVKPPHLLVAPASLVGNWTAELARFAPSLRVSVTSPDDADLVIATYGTVARGKTWLASTKWGLVIADEAQAIKNPGTRQTRAIKALSAQARIALTGTPIENRLGDLWSLFDFVNPGLLGTAKQFTQYTRGLEAGDYGPLRELIRPYLLRRMKTDRSVIADLPDKTEVTAYCTLSRKQAALYAQAVDDLAARLRGTKGIERRGAVLASLMRLKQICNHPSQWTGDGDWAPGDSGKLARVRELCEVIAAKQEKLLVFTQFREACAPLAGFLAGVFGRPGLILHGETAVKARAGLVREFQEDESIPFFVLSLKAGGTGLNLTAASHVLHFDRWWNPAVEDQATDRAFRIGQRRNVMVHKLVCRGTLEEKIDALIHSKRGLSKELLDGTSEVKLTELTDAELMKLVTLDLEHALGEDESS